VYSLNASSEDADGKQFSKDELVAPVNSEKGSKFLLVILRHASIFLIEIIFETQNGKLIAHKPSDG
jgi:hypothetical protein